MGKCSNCLFADGVIRLACGEVVCDACAEATTACERCQQPDWEENVFFFAGEEGPLCEECWEEANEELEFDRGDE